FRNLPKESIEEALLEIQKNLFQKVLLLGAPVIYKDFYTNAYLSLTKEGIQLLAEKEVLFPGLDDKVHIIPGHIRDVFTYKDIGLGILICFELRCPEIARFYIGLGVDGLIIPAQWPESRIEHFKALLKARAIENQIYVVGVNAIGQIGEILLGGNSSLYSPFGEELLNFKKEEGLKEITLTFELPKLPYPLKTPLIKNLKVKSLEEVEKISFTRRKKGQIMVFTNGCFDILHAGHVDYLQRARKLGDFLVVGLNSDRSVKAIKGENRPINPENYRIEVLSGLACVDYIILFDDPTPEALIRKLKPHILVKGADWEEDKIVGADFVKSYGGQVVRIEFNYEISTTKIIEKIQK
ncbi:MAG: D-glycero-beta-D-manno-heptose 1-phosphate adenylyltransferase, partial [Caldimicrobium sp.]